MMGMEKENLLFEVDGVSVRVMNEETLKNDGTFRGRNSILLDYPAEKMDELVKWLPFVDRVFKPQVIKGDSAPYKGTNFDPKNPHVMQSRLREDKINEKDGRVFTSLSCTTTFTCGVVAAVHEVILIREIIKGLITGAHTFTGENAVPFAGYAVEKSTGAAKATGLVFPDIRGWENFGGKVHRIHMEEPSMADITLEVDSDRKLNSADFTLAVLKLALEKPWLLGIIDYDVFPGKEEGFTVAIREAPNRAIVDIKKMSFDQRIGRFDLKDGKYNNVQGFNATLLEGTFKLLSQMGLKIDTKIFEKLPQSLAVMGKAALSLKIEDSEESTMQ
jgi:hypothetical protein